MTEPDPKAHAGYRGSASGLVAPPLGGRVQPGPAPARVPGSPGRRFLPATLGGRPAHLAAPTGRRGEAAQTRWSQAPAGPPCPPAEPRCGRGGGGGVPSFPLGPSCRTRAGCSRLLPLLSLRLSRPSREPRREPGLWESGAAGSARPRPPLAPAPCETPVKSWPLLGVLSCLICARTAEL